MTTYKDSGVDIDLANKSIEKIKDNVKSTFNKYTLSNLGAFGGCYLFPKDDYDAPVLVSSTDGVGTKLKIAFLSNKNTTIGQCLVNHCVNDILVLGAKPLFFLDYFATGKLDSDIFEDVFGELENLDFDTKNTFFVDYMLVFGSAIGEKYSQYLKGSILLTGSIKNNFAPKENSSQPGVIAYISMWRGVTTDGVHAKIDDKYRFDSYEDFFVRPDTLIIQFLMHYARKNDKRLMIIPNTRACTREIQPIGTGRVLVRRIPASIS